jgi:tetratricopeptide (TPR) repeat protein
LLQVPYPEVLILPDFWVGHYQLAQACEQRGEHDLALEALAKAAAFGGDNSKVLSLRGYVLGKIGRRVEALAVLRTLESLSRDRFVPPQALALVHVAIGDDDAVFRNLDAAVDAHDVHVVLLPGDPKWDSCRADPRFAAVLRRCGLAFANRAPQPMLA